MKSEAAGEQRLCLCDPPFEGRAILHLRFGGRCQSAGRAWCPHFVPVHPQGQAVLMLGQHLVEGIKARCPCPPSKGRASLAAAAPAEAPGIATKMM